jgi:hypothetical protein
VEHMIPKWIQYIDKLANTYLQTMETLVALWIHAGKIAQYIYQNESGMFVRNINGNDTPFLMEIIYDSFSDKYYLTCEWLTSKGKKQQKDGGAIHLFPINQGILAGDTLTIEKNSHIPSCYDWNSPTIVRKIEFKTTLDFLNTGYLKKLRSNSN